MPLQAAALWPALVQSERLAGAAEAAAQAAPGLGALQSCVTPGSICTGARRGVKKQEESFFISAAANRYSQSVPLQQPSCLPGCRYSTELPFWQPKYRSCFPRRGQDRRICITPLPCCFISKQVAPRSLYCKSNHGTLCTGLMTQRNRRQQAASHSSVCHV